MTDKKLIKKIKQHDNEFDELVKKLKVEGRKNFQTALKPPEMIEIPKTFFVS